MKLNRRQVITTALAASVSSAWPRTARAEGAPNLQSQFEKLGLTKAEPMPIVVQGSDFNGGLLYDESYSDMPKGSYLLQPCARIGDVEKKGRTGVLPMFHIARLDWPDGTSIEQGIANSLALLKDGLGLDTENVVLVGTPVLEQYRSIFDSAGIGNRQIIIRSEQEAKAAGNGSGVFRHPDDDAIEFVTAGIYLWLRDSPPASVNAYPLSDDWLEIGEISLDPSFPLGAGFGIERLLLAQGSELPDWEIQKQQLLEMIDSDSAGEIPAGRAIFENS
ncbi:MAG: hypothetical protein AAF362_11600 [Pseudomonadota bacterium]